MIRRIAASVAALIAATVLIGSPAQACEQPRHHGHAIVQPKPPVASPARSIDWD